MKSLLWVGLLFILVWDGAWYFLGVKPLFPWQLKGHLDRYQLVDVRTAREFGWFHIPGALNAPGLLVSPDSEAFEAEGKPIVIVCMTGHRSPLVVQRLQKRGLRRVYNLTWGMAGWKLFGGGTVKG